MRLFFCSCIRNFGFNYIEVKKILLERLCEVLLRAMQRANACEIDAFILLKMTSTPLHDPIALQDMHKWMCFHSTSLPGESPYPCKRVSNAALRVSADKYFRCHLQWWSFTSIWGLKDEYGESSIKKKEKGNSLAEREKKLYFNKWMHRNLTNLSSTCSSHISIQKSKEVIKLFHFFYITVIKRV